MADNDQEKTEPATPKKRQKSREDGQTAVSREISSVAILLSSLGFFYFGSSWLISQLSGFMTVTYENLLSPNFNIPFVVNLFWKTFFQFITVLSPLLLIIITAGITAVVAQIGFMFTGKPLVPKFNKFNPINGFKNLFSLKSVAEVVKSVIKLTIIGWVSISTVKGQLDAIPALIDLQVLEIFGFIGRSAFKISLNVGLVLILLAGLDFLFQRWQYEKKIKMTKQEIKDEHKNSEGDPQVKSRIRSVQRQMAMQRMMEAVPDATVVITNPTHLAIAIKFEDNLHAPVVVAKGAGVVAKNIREIAQEHGIPIIEQKPLARTLFKSTEIGDYIPVDLYRAVAEILAYVYRLKGLVKSA
ncbi:MAG: flagellar biosynthesis protein FlhB [Desulfobacteraceae bacterium]|nr:flagellar biosynthesis protein FlhB [Desulfobacteraceae bacterium]